MISIQIMVRAIAVLLLGTSLSLKANAQDCQLELATTLVRAERCVISTNQTLVIVRLNTQSPTVVKATFVTNRNLDTTAMMVATHMWQRLWVESGDRSLSASDQLRLRMDVFTKDPSTLDPNTHAVLDFLANFLDPDQVIESFDQTTRKQVLGLNDFFQYTMICDTVGQVRSANFSIKGTINNSEVIVGDPATRCRGRCGYSCQQPFQWRKNQYTQECLDHDVCRDTTESIFGQCTDEFWKAAIGYLIAPDCPTSTPPQSSFY